MICQSLCLIVMNGNTLLKSIATERVDGAMQFGLFENGYDAGCHGQPFTG
ncbi:protein of unknown function [Methylorubrum extorquens DM4]|uniref:Uncharacterized protein n=1 Tax=Methylorubrum extorquens (strain DSM 6343 / CIP 106787 / DM4) TaxID=661410 RepID=C7C7N5_METED|nr:protein of unknown function [Methylorubrum extorquens DM4]